MGYVERAGAAADLEGTQGTRVERGLEPGREARRNRECG